MLHTAWHHQMGRVLRSELILSSISHSRPVSPLPFHVHAPMMGMATQSYSDIQNMLDSIKQQLCTQHGWRYVLLIGDQQTFSRMWDIKVRRPIEHQWLVPFAGDWHFLVHVCTAIFSIWWEQVLEPLCQFVPRFGMARSMKLSAWPVYDEVLKIVAQAMLEWLTEIGGDADLQDPLELLQQCDNNRAVSTCLGFLFHGAIFYVQLQEAVHRGDVATLDWAWQYAATLFHLARKPLYFSLCIAVRYLLLAMHPVAAQVLVSHRLVWLHKHASAQVPLDQVCEQV
jgi:hypothetical protein